jgi:hypothetical protein
MPRVTITLPAIFEMNVPDDSPLNDLQLIDLAVDSLNDIRQHAYGFTFVTTSDADEVRAEIENLDFTFDWDEDNPQRYVVRHKARP